MQLILLVDSRHKPSEDDCRMLKSIKSAGGMAVVIATKTDKLSKKQLDESLLRIVEVLDLTDGDILLPFSVKSAESAEDFWDYIHDYILYDEEEDEE